VCLEWVVGLVGSEFIGHALVGSEVDAQYTVEYVALLAVEYFEVVA